MESANHNSLGPVSWLESRVALYLEVVNMDQEKALERARAAVAEARESLGPEATEEKILNLALKIIQAFVVCPLARSRPLSLSHMLPEGFVVKPVKSCPSAGNA